METVEVDRSDVQGMLVSAYSHLKRAAYLFLQIHDAVGARQWLAQMLPSISSGELWPTGPTARRSSRPSRSTSPSPIPVFAALKLPHKTLESFLPPFTLGAAARTDVAGDVGEARPSTGSSAVPIRPLSTPC